MASVLQELKYALRSLSQKPAFTLVVIVTLALGIGANTAIFSVIKAILLSPLAYEDPDRVVMVWSRWQGWDKTWVSNAELLDYEERAKTLSRIGAWSSRSVNLTGEGEPERVSAAAVTEGLFPALGVSSLLGRAFTPEEDTPGNDAVAVLGWTLWQRRYGGRTDIVGRSVEVDGQRRTVVGVLPGSFKLPLDYQEEGSTELWVPLAIDRQNLSRGSHGLFAAARLAPGVSVEQATADLKAITTQLTEDGLYPREMRFEAFAVTVAEEVTGSIRPALVMLLVAVGFLLLIACANVANLLLARADARQREIAVRTALGAGRRRLVQQLLTESMVLACLGGTFGLALAYGGTVLLRTWSPRSVPRVAEVGVDGAILLFTLAISVVTGVLFGLVPALRASRLDIADSFKEGSSASTIGTRRQWLRRALVVSELGLAVVLLIGAGLTLRSFWELRKIEPGFDSSNVLTLRMSLPQATYSDPTDVVRFYNELLEKVRSVSGVQNAGTVRLLPLTSTMGDWSIEIEGREPRPGDNPKGDWQVVSDGYFESMGVQLVDGRSIGRNDRAETLQVVVINQTMADLYWPSESAIGKRFRMGGPERPWITIVGIVRDERQNEINEIVKEKFYRPMAQFHLSSGSSTRAMTLVVKTAADSGGVLAPIRETIRSLDPNVPVYDVQTMEDVVAASVSEPRFTLMLLGLFAGVSLILASVGIYGVLSYLVGQRIHEIGIRMALGAGAGTVLRMVLKQAALLALAGMALGVTLALGLTRLMTGLLYGVRPTDPLTFLGIVVVLVTVALVASYAPARRAARVDPMRALRME
ncbi:MAG TPA: ABC transporter permease [Vicinamibacteria bacterium]|nr:ABC transporter permease [Vicinamibacteria bacterium]